MRQMTGWILGILAALPAVAAQENVLQRAFSTVIDIFTLSFINITDETQLIGVARLVMFIILFALLNQVLKRIHVRRGMFGRAEGGLFEKKQAGIISFALAAMITLLMPGEWILSIFSIYGIVALMLLLIIPFLWAINYARSIETAWVRLVILVIGLWGFTVIGTFVETGIEAVPGISTSTAATWGGVILTTVGIAQILLIIGIIMQVVGLIGHTPKGTPSAPLRGAGPGIIQRAWNRVFGSPTRAGAPAASPAPERAATPRTKEHTGPEPLNKAKNNINILRGIKI